MSAKTTSTADGKWPTLCTGLFYDPHLMARLDQLLHEVAADETCSAGHDRESVHSSSVSLSAQRHGHSGSVTLDRFTSHVVGSSSRAASPLIVLAVWDKGALSRRRGVPEHCEREGKPLDGQENENPNRVNDGSQKRLAIAPYRDQARVISRAGRDQTP